MRKIVLLAFAVGVVLAGLPAGADEHEPEPTLPCDEAEGRTVLTPAGFAEQFDAALTPSVVHDEVDFWHEEAQWAADVVAEEAGQEPQEIPNPELPMDGGSWTWFDFRLDVSDASPNKRARVRVDLAWELPGDFDLYVYDAAGSELGSSHAFNPQGENTESVLLSTVTHCTDFTVGVNNWLGSPGAEMDLNIVVNNLRL